MTETASDDSDPWLTAMTEYEGYPLALRVRPDADGPASRAAFPYLGVVTHQLAQVHGNGLPIAEYNESLEEFDLGLQEAMAGGGAGLVVLVETFAGKRTYYAYASDEHAFTARVRAFADAFTQHSLSTE